MSVLQEQLDTLSLLQAMYPLQDELSLHPDTAALFDTSSSGASPIAPDMLDLTLTLPLDSDPTCSLQIQISLSTSHPTGAVTPRHPPWLSRSSFEALLGSYPPHDTQTETVSEYIPETIERIRTEAESIVQSQPSEATAAPTPPPAAEPGPLERVWFWFPMLSTREKRKDLIEYAPNYGLCGFVIAGKPALLCLEGDGKQVDKYMSDIKSISWSDIPSYQKKVIRTIHYSANVQVTERLRRPLEESGRRFKAMTDATPLVPTYGQYNHRGDMGEVRRLMETWGVGDDFGAVILNAGS